MVQIMKKKTIFGEMGAKKLALGKKIVASFDSAIISNVIS